MSMFRLYVQDLVERISGSGEHFSLCKGARDCKRLFYALVVKYSKYRLGVLPSILDDCII